jgi:hypothetical protein
VHGEEPDAMLNPEDVSAAQDATEPPAALSTWLRFGHMIPALGPVTVCYLSPASATWTPLFAPLVGVDAGPPEAGPADGSYDAALEGGPDGAPHDAHAEAPEASAHEGGLSDASSHADGHPPSDAEAGDAGPPPDLLPFTMSRYIELKGAGTFKLAVLPAGVGSCEGTYFTQSVTLDSEKHSTVLLVRTLPGTLGSARSYLTPSADAAAPFGLIHFTDESSTTSPGALTRFINAVVPAGADAGGGGPLSVAVLDTTADLVPLATVVPPDHASTPSQVSPTVDALGYHAGAATVGPLAIRLTPAGARGDAGALPWTSAAELLSMSAGSIHTAFILTDLTEQFLVLWCNDLSDDPVLTECGLIGQ